MIKKILIFLACFMLASVTLLAQEIEVQQFDFATSIDDRAPTGVDTSFSADVGNIYCFTRIRGASNSPIAHVWYYKDEEKARINLEVQSDDWRTWSSKTILETWTGRWRVMVEDSSGNVIETKSFTVRD